MKVLGISGRDRDAAAALSVDGRIVSAASEESFARIAGIGYAQTGGYPPRAVQSCLDAAGFVAEDIDEIVVVDDSPAEVPGQRFRARALDPTEADARHAAMTDPDAGIIVVCGETPAALAVFRSDAGRLGPRQDIAGAAALFESAARLSVALGAVGKDHLSALDELGAGAESEFAADFDSIIKVDGHSGAIEVDSHAVHGAAVRFAGDHAASLDQSRSLNARVQYMRRAIAASFTSSLARAVAKVSESAGAGNGSARLGVGGSAFGNPRFNSELQNILGSRLSFAAVPEPSGRALGASGATATALSALAIGPAFDEEAIKRTLDNCRLDYVYEPDWPRLLARVSRMLGQGKLVGWFQGPMAFGPRSLGARSVLADPSNRYARQNVNEYLRELPLDDPLPLVVAPSMAAECLTSGLPADGTRDVAVRKEWQARLASALDGRHNARVQAPVSRFEPRLRELLELHHASTGTPGLIEIGLAGRGEPTACSPRDAVRTLYSSAIDALVLGRFLLMKDYWLLRSQE